jgi:hypothetical protein
MLFKPGDVVVIDNLDRYEGDEGVVDNMYAYLGKEAIIVDAFEDYSGPYYQIDLDGQYYYWGERWLIGKNAPKRKRKVGKIKASKSAIKKKIAEARKNLRLKANNSSCCSYALIREDEKRGLIVDAHINDICHARMGSPRKVHALVDFLGKPKERFSKKEYRQFLKFADYMLNRSWIKYAFLPTTVSSYIRNGVLINTEVSATEAFAALICLRMGSERKGTFLPVFTYLVNKGYPEDFAFVMGNTFSPSKGKGFRISIPGSHSPISYYCNRHKVLDMAKGKLEFKKSDPYSIKSLGWALHGALGEDHNPGVETYGGYIKGQVEKVIGPKDNTWGTAFNMNTAQFDTVIRNIAEQIGAVK